MTKFIKHFVISMLTIIILPLSSCHRGKVTHDDLSFIVRNIGYQWYLLHAQREIIKPPPLSLVPPPFIDPGGSTRTFRVISRWNDSLEFQQDTRVRGQ